MTATQKIRIIAAGLAAATITAGCQAPPSTTPPAAARSAPEPELADVRKATERFTDVNVALAEGYIRDPFDLCDTAEMMGRPAALGAMGVHYFKPDVLGITGPPNPRVNGTGTHTDFLTPAILIYEPQADGSLQLVAVENLAFEAAWKAAGHSAPPTFHGMAYNYMADDPETPADDALQFAPHYDRHVWIYRDNPNGVFAPFNPAVTCAYHKGATLKTTHSAIH
ncbi:MAG: hypothetical protein RLZZ53_1554 [Acidobacteriota bacterium]|jgi:hypothetical protein